jgi:hypothetical protein
VRQALSPRRVRLGLRENLEQLSPPVTVNAFVGAMVRLGRWTAPSLPRVLEAGFIARLTLRANCSSIASQTLMRIERS